MEVITTRLDAIPLLVPSVVTSEDIDTVLDRVDGLYLPGGVSNVHPTHYGEEPLHELQVFDTEHDQLDMMLLENAIKRDLPILAVCRGMQILNVLLGGTLRQTIINDGAIDHMCSEDSHGRSASDCETHPIEIQSGGYLANWLGGPQMIRVNSLHEQAVGSLGEGLRLEAVAPDGVIEAFSCPDESHFVLGVQWHPDYCPETQDAQIIFAKFREAVVARRG